MVKAIVDANIWVSALINPGNARKIRDHLAFNRFQTFYSSQIFVELTGVLTRPKFRKYFTRADVDRFVNFFTQRGVLLQVESSAKQISRDPDDNIYLLCAAAAESDFVVTGDDDLLCLTEYGGIRIVTPKQFLEILEA